MRSILVLVIALLALTACQKKTVDTSAGALQLALDNRVGNSDLALGTGTYQNKSGETFTVTRFDYFISNIRLLRADGSAYTVPQDDSYFLIREADPASQTVTLNNVPAGEYTQLEFMVGVDSLRNTADVGKRTGVLDPAGSHTSGMYWDWNTGYIHLKLEGTSPQAPLDATGSRNFRYHIGLFGGYQTPTLNNLRTVRVPLSGIGKGVQIGNDFSVAALVTVNVDAGKLFDGPTPISIATYPDVMVSPISATIATNYATMFSLKASSFVSR
ncbi:MbnP family protein [Fibrella arboris]|uniref:MbnP family protein n=1 Tax=Fibrella arboris TaxID=3242486 RepID=UPI00351F95CB